MVRKLYVVVEQVMAIVVELMLGVLSYWITPTTLVGTYVRF
jgi:hypothetical protein